MKFWCDFSASIEIEAKDSDEVMEKFYEGDFDFNQCQYIELYGIEPQNED